MYYSTMKGFLEAISKLKDLDKTIFVAILFKDKATVDSLLPIYLSSKPEWLEAFTNAPDFETGRSEALDCIIGDYTVLGEI